MSTRVYHPDIRITLHKTVRRDQIAEGAPVSGRYKGSAGTIDLTPFLTESSGSVRTAKSIREPAGGFSISLGDSPNKSPLGFESMYALIEPMDFIEIRMRHGTPGMGSGPVPPIVMRGFVTSVGRAETIGGDGKPSRSVVISGQDYGKLWQMLQILYLPGYVVGQDTLTSFRLFERFGVGFKTAQKGAEFLKEIIEKILNPYVKNLMPENSPNPKEIKLDRVTAKHGTTSLTGSQNQEGTIYNLLQVYLDVGIWNELYMEDDEDGVYCVYRPNPYKTVAGKKIQDDAPDLKAVVVEADDVVSLQVERSDADVANYYWVRGARFDLNTEVFRKQFSVTGEDKKTVLLDKYPNTDSKLYGIRVMMVDTMMGGDEETTFGSGQDKAKQDKRDTGVANWVNDRRKILVEQNKDNVVLERGSMRIRGNEAVRAGGFVRLSRGGFSAEYYVTQVTHDFVAFQGFYTTLNFERGMGFAERSKREGGPDSPYLSEMRGL
jgi:hypothetical protein